jgi:hypothetical protein
MGVMSCSRKRCPNIMCDTHIDDIGYICYDCQKEFKLYLTEMVLNPKTPTEIHNELEKFMKTTPRINYGDFELSIDEFFRINRIIY